MKKLLSAALALAMLLTVIAPVFAAPTHGASWDADKRTFTLKDPPILTGIREDSNEAGTDIYAYFRVGDEAQRLMDEYNAADGSDERMYARALGMDEEDVEASIWVHVQFAYSFDGANWVYDWDTDPDPEDLNYYPNEDFDFDGDGFYEYRNMPNKDLNFDKYYYEAEVVQGRQNCFEAQYCDDDIYSIEEAIRRCNQAMLQGKGEYLGSYERDQDDSSYGMAIDLNSNTVYIKARYRVFQWVNRRVGDDWLESGDSVSYSDWSAPTSYNKSTAPALPDMKALNTDAPLTLETLERYTETKDRDGVDVKITRYRMAVRYPAATEAALGSFYALDYNRELRKEITGEWYDPDLVIEMKVGNGAWYYLTDIRPSDPYFEFSDDIYWMRDEMEALGYQPDDPVYLRAVLYGDDSWTTEKDDATGVEKVTEKGQVNIRSGRSNVVEMNLTGKFNVHYELDGGAFPEGSKQLTQFDEDTNVTVDLTAADYIPARVHFVFKGWFEDKAFTNQVYQFSTAEKRSRTFYAKWDELPYYTLTYDYGIVTGDVYNPNPDRIYSDSGEAHNGVIALENVSYAGVDFLGWYDAPEGGNKIESITFAALTGSITLYARWNVPTFTITYAGAGTDYTNNAKNHATYQVSPAGGTQVWLYAPEKTGFIFDGWFLNADLTHDGLFHNAEKDAWLLDESSNVTVYAKFIRGRWNVNYVLGLDDAWNGANPEKHTYGEAVTLKAPSRTGYTFEGWFKDQAFTQPVSVIPDDTVGEVTVYAKWTAIIYTVEYDLRDPDAARCFGNPNPTTRTVDEEIVLQPLTPITKLYRFTGWFDNVNFDGNPVKVIPKGTDKNVRLYANVEKYLWGDVDFDGQVTTGDARLVLRAAVGLDTFTAEQAAWGDLDKHSAAHEIGTGDARLVLRIAVDLDTPESIGLPEVPEGF